jgi:hypothetical protein
VGGFPWLKGHGTENDFVLLPGADGSLHGDLDDDLMRFLCDRHAGIGADGVLRIVAGDKQSYVEDEAVAQAQQMRDLLECVWPAALETANWPFRSRTWAARCG